MYLFYIEEELLIYYLKKNINLFKKILLKYFYV